MDCSFSVVGLYSITTQKSRLSLTKRSSIYSRLLHHKSIVVHACRVRSNGTRSHTCSNTSRPRRLSRSFRLLITTIPLGIFPEYVTLITVAAVRPLSHISLLKCVTCTSVTSRYPPCDACLLEHLEVDHAPDKFLEACAVVRKYFKTGPRYNFLEV